MTDYLNSLLLASHMSKKPALIVSRGSLHGVTKNARAVFGGFRAPHYTVNARGLHTELLICAGERAFKRYPEVAEYRDLFGYGNSCLILDEIQRFNENLLRVTFADAKRLRVSIIGVTYVTELMPGAKGALSGLVG